MATTRTLSFYGYKLGLDSASITATFDGTPIHTGAVSNENDDIIFTHTVPITEVTVDQIPQQMTNDQVPLLTTEHIVLVACTAGTVRISDVRSPRLDAWDELPLILDAANYGFPGQPATNFDAKYDVQLDGVSQTIERLEQATGGWHYTVPTGSTLCFKIRVFNHVQMP